MRRIFTYLLFLLLPPLALQAQVAIDATNFPDNNFRTYVATFDTDGDGTLSQTEIKKVKSINVEKKSIAQLDGIEFFTAITSLKCDNNNLTSLDLSSNTKLKTLSCQANSLTSLNVVGCTALEKMYCQTNQLVSLTVASTALTELYANNNSLTSVDITGCPNLATLRLYRNPNLQYVDFSGNSKMKRLDIYSCALTSIDVSNMPDLEWLAMSDNQLTEIDVTNNPLLYNLTFSNNNVSELDISNNPWLKTLRFENNNISEIDVAHLSELTLFTCSNNNIAELNVTNSPKLTTFRCEGNQLTQLDVTKNPALVHFQCDDNQLTTLDLSNNTKLGLVHNPGVSKYYKISPQETVIDAVVVGDNREKVAIPLVLSSEQSTMDASQFSKCIIGVNQTFTAGVVDNNLVVKDDPQEDVDLYGAKVSYTYTVPCGTNAATTAQKAMQVKVTTYPYVMYVNPNSMDGNGGFYSGTLMVDYDAVVPEGINAYVATGINNEVDPNDGTQSLSMTSVGVPGDVIPANTPIYVRSSSASGLYAFSVNRTEKMPVVIPSGNLLQGTLSDMAVTANSVLTLGREKDSREIGFWPFLGSSVAAHRAYVDASLVSDGNSANGFFFNFDGDTNTVEQPAVEINTDNEGPWYSLQGVRLMERPSQKGVYICNGKKTIIK